MCWPNHCTAKPRFSIPYSKLSDPDTETLLTFVITVTIIVISLTRRDEAILMCDAFFLQWTLWFLIKSVWSKKRKKKKRISISKGHLCMCTLAHALARGHPRTQDHLPPSATPSEVLLPPFYQRAQRPWWSHGVQDLSPLHHSVSVPHSSHFIWGSRVQTAPWERCRYRVGREALGRGAGRKKKEKK